MAERKESAAIKKKYDIHMPRNNRYKKYYRDYLAGVDQSNHDPNVSLPDNLVSDTSENDEDDESWSGDAEEDQGRPQRQGRRDSDDRNEEDEEDDEEGEDEGDEDYMPETEFGEDIEMEEIFAGDGRPTRRRRPPARFNPQDSDSQEGEEEEGGKKDTDTSDLETSDEEEDHLMKRISEARQYRLRTRYPLCGSTGRKWANVQRKPGITLNVEVNDDPEYRSSFVLMPYHNARGTCILQIYEPSGRAGLKATTHRKIRWLARLLPKMIAQFASQVEEVVSAGHPRKNRKKKKRLLDVFDTILECYEILQSWLERLKTHTMQARYEMTFATAIRDQNRLNIYVPISASTSPLQCLSFVNRNDLFEDMQNLVGKHREILVDGFCHLKPHENRHLKEQVQDNVWAAYIASAEITKLLMGLSGGSKGTILHTSLQRADGTGPESLYDHMSWVVHPSFIKPVEAQSWTKVTMGVDPAICEIPLVNIVAQPEEGDEDEEDDTGQVGKTLRRDFGWLQGNLPVHEIQGIKGLRCPSQFVKCAKMMFLSLVRIGNPDADPTLLGMFSKVDSVAIGQSEQRIIKLFDAWAHDLIALYKVEYAERYVVFLKSHAHEHAPIHIHDTHFLVREMYNCNTVGEISEYFKEHLRSFWSHPIRPTNSTVTTPSTTP